MHDHQREVAVRTRACGVLAWSKALGEEEWHRGGRDACWNWAVGIGREERVTGATGRAHACLSLCTRALCCLPLLAGGVSRIQSALHAGRARRRAP
eukprot:6179358-Pleurochrysis_carterae.AAC.4